MNPILYTIGYERLPFGVFEDILKCNKIDLLIDIRAVPQSRKPGFSKSYLTNMILPFEYRHMPELGNPKAGRDAAKRGDTAEFHRIYRAHLETPSARRALEELKSSSERGRVCLTCYERDPQDCHRLLVTKAMQLKGVSAKHIVVADWYLDKLQELRKTNGDYIYYHLHNKSRDPQNLELCRFY